MLAFPDRPELGGLAADGEQGDRRIAEPEGGQTLELLAEIQGQLPPVGDGVDREARHEIAVREHLVRVASKASPKRSDVVRQDREPGCGPVAAVALEVLRARAQAAVQVERRDRAARPDPGALLRARDEDDRTVEALHEPRGHDPDHAAVPVLAGDDVRAATALRLGPGLDLPDGVAEDPVFDPLPVPVQRLELSCEALSLARPR